MSRFDSRKQFEEALTREIRDMDRLFKAFARHERGHYLRDQVEERWLGWEMHRRASQSDAGAKP